MKRTVTSIVFVLLCSFAFGQSPFDSSVCNKIYEGYILRIFENSKPYTLRTADYFFCSAVPSFLNEPDFALLIKKYPLLNERYYEDINEEKYYQYDVFNYYYLGKVFDSVVLENYKIDIYRVLVAGYIKKEDIANYVSHNRSSHRHSVYDVHNKKEGLECNILYPNMIVLW